MLSYSFFINILKENQKEIETLTARIHMQDDEMAALKQEKDQLLYGKKSNKNFVLFKH